MTLDREVQLLSQWFSRLILNLFHVKPQVNPSGTLVSWSVCSQMGFLTPISLLVLRVCTIPVFGLF